MYIKHQQSGRRQVNTGQISLICIIIIIKCILDIVSIRYSELSFMLCCNFLIALLFLSLLQLTFTDLRWQTGAAYVHITKPEIHETG